MSCCIFSQPSIILMVLTLSAGETGAKEDFPAQQQQAQEDSRVQSPHGDQERALGAEEKTRKRPKEAVGEWIRGARSDFPGG